MNRIYFLSSLFYLTLFACTTKDQKVGKNNATSTKVGSSVYYVEPNVEREKLSSGFEDSYRDQATLSNSETYSWGSTYAVSSVQSSSLTSSSNISASSNSKEVKKQQKIIKNGTLRIKTKHFKESKKAIDKLVQSYGGDYETEELDKNEERIQFYLIIRVAPKKFERFIQSLESGKGEVEYKKINANNVTEEFLDIETRLENKRKYLKRYHELLSKAKNVNEILNIEENIRQLMEEIESKEGRLKYLNDQVDLSTIQITLYKEFTVKEAPVYHPPFLARAKNALITGWNSIISFLLWTVSKWPFIIILSITTWYVRKRLRNRNKLNAN